MTDDPRFAEPIPNVTVALGRDASLPCVVENLGTYKIAAKFSCVLVLPHLTFYGGLTDLPLMLQTPWALCIGINTKSKWVYQLNCSGIMVY
ncbi:hypothetical protein WA026_004421 [Henosepilachna vigintioctopunctata]|uniref:Uncharacterized protein n=1 Tax=Henosepilachna vigintioctopunctata TaxID=420089 RepID=A0AAW1V7M4_9CUCU